MSLFRCTFIKYIIRAFYLLSDVIHLCTSLDKHTHTLSVCLSLPLTHTNMHAHSLSVSLSRSHTQARTHTLCLSLSPAHTHKHARTLSVCLSLPLTHTNTHAHSLSVSLSRSHTQTRTLTQTHTQNNNAQPLEKREIRALRNGIRKLVTKCRGFLLSFPFDLSEASGQRQVLAPPLYFFSS